MNNIKNIIFDFDGVLVRNSKLLLKTHRETLGEFSQENFENLFDGNTAEFLKNYDKDKMNNFWKKWEEVLNKTKINEEALNFLMKNNKKRKFIISSNSEPILETIIKNSSAEKYFEKVLGRETHKSKVSKFLILKNEKNINFSETIFITDSLGDLKESSEFSELKTIGVTFGVHSQERLKKGSPDFIVDSWDEIEKILLK